LLLLQSQKSTWVESLHSFVPALLITVNSDTLPHKVAAPMGMPKRPCPHVSSRPDGFTRELGRVRRARRPALVRRITRALDRRRMMREDDDCAFRLLQSNS
jgi:hypothetical protein